MYTVPFYLHSCQYLLSVVFLIIASLTGVKWYIIVVLICITLMIRDLSIFSYTLWVKFCEWYNFYWCLSEHQLPQMPSRTRLTSLSWMTWWFYPHTECYIPYMCMLSHFSCVWLCDPMDFSLPGSSVHGILQARMLEWVAISSSRGSFPPRDGTHVYLCLLFCWWILYHWAPAEALYSVYPREKGYIY